jgi:hypothetical protein
VAIGLLIGGWATLAWTLLFRAEIYPRISIGPEERTGFADVLELVFGIILIVSAISSMSYGVGML